jgi:hypothetical protein
MRRCGIAVVVVIGAILAPLPVIADVVGTNIPATPLTAERISALPAAARAAWSA